jgi:hypothetical protein
MNVVSLVVIVIIIITNINFILTPVISYLNIN